MKNTINFIEEKKTSKLQWIMFHISIAQIFLYDFLNYYLEYSPLIISCLMMLVIFFEQKKIIINKYLIGIYIYILFVSLINILFGNIDVIFFAKQYIGIIVCTTLLDRLIPNFKMEYLVRVYLRWAVFVAGLTFIQEIMYNAGIAWPFVFGMDYQYRMTSIFGEPSYLGMVISPAIYICLEALINGEREYNIKTYHYIILFGAMFLTYSTISYVIFFIAVLLTLRNKRNIFLKTLVFGVLLLAAFTVYTEQSGVQDRIDGLISGLFYHEDLFDKNSVNGSSGIWIINLQIAMEAFMYSLGLGCGLGSHATSSIRNLGYININGEDACSLFIRLLSEFGLIGIGVLAWFIIKFHVKSKGTAGLKSLNIISNFALIEIVGHLLRQGNYFWENFIIFPVIYLCAYKRSIYYHKR